MIWLLASWKWVVPLVLVAGLGIDDSWQHLQLARLRASQAQEIALAEATVRKALQADQAFSNTLVGKYAAEIATLQEGLARALAEQSKAASIPACDHSPAARTFDRGLRYLYSPPAPPPHPAR